MCTHLSWKLSANSSKIYEYSMNEINFSVTMQTAETTDWVWRLRWRRSNDRVLAFTEPVRIVC